MLENISVSGHIGLFNDFLRFLQTGEATEILQHVGASMSASSYDRCPLSERYKCGVSGDKSPRRQLYVRLRESVRLRELSANEGSTLQYLWEVNVLVLVHTVDMA